MTHIWTKRREAGLKTKEQIKVSVQAGILLVQKITLSVQDSISKVKAEIFVHPGAESAIWMAEDGDVFECVSGRRFFRGFPLAIIK